MIRTALTTLIIVQAAAAHAQYDLDAQIRDNRQRYQLEEIERQNRRIESHLSDLAREAERRRRAEMFGTPQPGITFTPTAGLPVPPPNPGWEQRVDAALSRQAVHTEYERRRKLLARRRERIQGDYYAARPQPAPVVQAVEHNPYTPPAKPADQLAERHGEQLARGELFAELNSRDDFRQTSIEPRNIQLSAGQPARPPFWPDQVLDTLSETIVAGLLVGAVLCGLAVYRRRFTKETPHT